MFDSFKIHLDFPHRFHFECAKRRYASESTYWQDCRTLISTYLCFAYLVKSDENRPYGYLSGTSFDAEDALTYLSSFPRKPQPLPDNIVNTVIQFEAQMEHRLDLTPDARSTYRLCRIRELFHLDDFAYFCLLCSLTAEFDRGFESAYYLFQSENDTQHPSAGLLRSLYSMIHPQQPAREMLLFDSSNLSSRLFLALRQRSAVLMPVILHPHVISFLAGKDYRDTSFFEGARLIQGENQDELLFCDRQYQSVLTLSEADPDRFGGRLVTLCGPESSGKKLTLHKICRETGRIFLLLRLSEWESSPEAFRELLLYVLLDNCAICLEDDDFESPDALVLVRQILTELEPYHPLVILLAKKLRCTPVFPGYLCRRVEYPLPDQETALHLWETFSADYALSPELDWKTISGRFSLTPGKIKSALLDASLNLNGQELTPERLRASILNNSTTRLSQLADRVEPFFTWDDLILDDASKDMLRNVCNRIKYRYKVDEQWGFKGKSAYGKGISILLYGPPGTGKTMSAQVLARELWLPLYRINLSQIMSKYIGETAKNLDAIFNEAKGSNVILFFDEADSLFSKRTDVSSSNDRHSNAETSYLLQKIEDFSGVSILATNLANNFDDAFRRRIQYMINIHMPSEEQRLILWQNAFPQAAPLSDDIDFALLAGCLEISGSVIKSAALQSAYFAADENSEINMSHVVRAVRGELAKLGKTEPPYLQFY